MQTDGRTDKHDESTSAFRDYVANPEHSLQCSLPLITTCFFHLLVLQTCVDIRTCVFMEKAMFVRL